MGSFDDALKSTKQHLRMMKIKWLLASDPKESWFVDGMFDQKLYLLNTTYYLQFLFDTIPLARSVA